MTQVANVPGVCVSCSSPLTGRYCSRCGEEVLTPHSLTIRHFFTETLADEFLHVDAKVWRTARLLLFRPGFLSEEYCAGRRRPYIGPVRLLAVAILAYALLVSGSQAVTLQVFTIVLSVAPTKVAEGFTVEDTIGRLDRFHVLTPMLERQQHAVDLHDVKVHDQFHRRLESVYEPLSFANVILFALTLWALFGQRRARLVEHAIFSVHFASFILLSSLLYRPAVRSMYWWHAIWLFPLFAVMIWQFAYLATAIRRFYFGGTTRWLGRTVSIAAAIVLYILNSAFITAAQTIGAAYALWRI
jgi:hypothetical protein